MANLALYTCPYCSCHDNNTTEFLNEYNFLSCKNCYQLSYSCNGQCNYIRSYQNNMSQTHLKSNRHMYKMKNTTHKTTTSLQKHLSLFHQAPKALNNINESSILSVADYISNDMSWDSDNII